MSARDDKAHRGIHIHSTVPLSSQPFSLLSFLSSFPRLSFTSHKPPFSFSSSFSSSSWQAFVLLCCPDTFHRERKREGEEGKKAGKRMERMRKKRGKESGNASDASEGHFLSHCCGRERRVSQQRESWGIKQRVTEMERWRNSQIMEETCMKRDWAVCHSVKSRCARPLATLFDSSSFPHHPTTPCPHFHFTAFVPSFHLQC